MCCRTRWTFSTNFVIPQTQASKRCDMTVYDLYVARDKKMPQRMHIGSIAATHLVKHLPPDHVNVVSVHDLSPMPTWLQGTPTLVQNDTANIWTGFEAYNELLQLTLAQTQRRSTGQARTASASGTVGREQTAKVQQHTGVRTAPMLKPQVQLSSRPSRVATNETPDDDEGAAQFWTEAPSLPVDDDASYSDAKLSSDDLQRAVDSRKSTMTAQTAPPGNAPTLTPEDD